MYRAKHQWATFHKGRIKIRACAICGEIHFPTSDDHECPGDSVETSQIVKAGYKLYGGRISLQ